MVMLFFLVVELFSANMTIKFCVSPVIPARMLFVFLNVDKKALVFLQEFAFWTIGTLFFGLLRFALVAAGSPRISLAPFYMLLQTSFGD